jgi:PhnB protein
MNDKGQKPPTIPEGYTAVTPWIVSADTRKLLDFLTEAFAATVMAVIDNPDGSVGHAEAKIGDAVVMGFDVPTNPIPRPAYLRLYVADAQATFDKALAAGASAVTMPTLLAFGDRVARVQDPLGNIWWLQERVEEVEPDEMARRWSDPAWTRAMAYVQSTLAEALSRDDGT